MSMRGATARRRRTFLAAVITSGPVDVLDFLIPLWAGALIGATSSQVGLLVAVELILSFMVRPLAGHLADTRERTRVAALGAALYAVSFLGYAVAQTISVAYLAAAFGGVGGALLWVSLRAIAAESLAEEPGVFASLLGAESTGSWLYFIPAIGFIGFVGYRGVFLALGLSCLVAAVLLLHAPARHVDSRAAGRSPARLLAKSAKVRPLLLVTLLSTAAEAGIGLILLLHLQRAYELSVPEIALVFLPGAIAMSVLPSALHRLVERLGRRLMFAVSSLASAAFAISLPLADRPVTISVLWILTACAWATVGPIERAVLAEGAQEQTGQAMGIYDAAALLGGAAGYLLGGAVYQGGNWSSACLVLGGIIATGAVLGPWALTSIGAADRPRR